MATNLKRFTVTIPQSMEVELDAMKRQQYYSKTQSELIRDLLMRGLEVIKKEQEKSQKSISNKTQP